MKPQTSRWRRRAKSITLLVLILIGYSLYALYRPLGTLRPVNVLDQTERTAAAPALPWPAYGQAAVGAVGYGLLAHNGTETPMPTASTIKVLTALSVLQKKPLKLGEQGPTITLTDADVSYYDTYVAEDGSVVPVYAGEQITEYQALQALLLPSANNMAKTLALWAFGSEKAYLDYAGTYAKELGLTHTHVADASGFSPQTTSTATDLVRLGEAALLNPVIQQIVAQPGADFPYTNGIVNVNHLLGQDGINGIKTGNTDEAGGVYLVSGSYDVLGHTVTVVEAIMGAPSLFRAMHDAPSLLDAARANFGVRSVVPAGTVVGYYNAPWGGSSNIVTQKDLIMFGWKGSTEKLSTSLQSSRLPVRRGQAVGSLSARSTTETTPALVTLVAQTSLEPPSAAWRLLHP